MKLLFVTTSFETGGAQRALYEIIYHSKIPAEKILVIALLGKGRYSEAFNEIGIKNISLKINSPLIGIYNVFKTIFLLKKLKPKVIQGWMYHGNLLALFYSRFLSKDVKVYWGVRQTLYDINKEKYLTRLIIKFSTLLSKKTNKIIYNSKLSMHQHEKFGFSSSKSLYIPNGFNTKELKFSSQKRKIMKQNLSIDEDSFVIGYLGRNHPMKNIDLLFRIALEVLRLNSKAIFIIVGEGISNKFISDKNISKNITDRLKILGLRFDVPDLLNTFDLLCLTSKWGEGFPNVIGEAMSYSIPCVSSDVGDSKSIINDLGWIVSQNDSENEYINYISKAMKLDKNSYKRLKSNCREKIKNNYQIEQISYKYMKLYETSGN